MSDLIENNLTLSLHSLSTSVAMKKKKTGLIRNSSDEVPVEHLTSVISYNKDTGIFERKKSLNNSVKKLGSISQGYIVIQISGIKYLAHRLAWAICYGKFPDGQLDHINGDKTDNRIENLRIANHSQNQGNTKSYSKYKTKGVSILPSGNWMAKIGGKKHSKYLGSYQTKDEAAHAYNKAAILRFGEFAVLNPIGNDYV